MKSLAIPLAALLFIAPMGLASDLAKPDARALAIGYCTAFENMGKSSVAILYENGGQAETIKDVNQITAYESALLVKTFGGGKQILDAARVIKITSN